MSKNQPIVAIATPPGRGGIGVVRVSGPELTALMTGLLGRRLPARHASLTDFRGGQGDVIDRGIALYFPAPHSYTGEDVLELQGHGGAVVMQLLLERCLELGARVAEPGEFTRRAYLNDKLDLAQAEAVADLIEASTASAARHALRSLQGEYSERINELIRELIDLRALVEAALDFPDEDIEFVKQAQVETRLKSVREQVQLVLAASRRGRLLREGLHVALAGRPNVGKSSLLNRLAGEDHAIVTPVPGTTRDVIRLSIALEGVPIHLVDTAGLRSTDDPVESIGITRAWAAIQQADLVVLMLDATSGETEGDRALIDKLPDVPCLRVINKIDLTGGEPGILSENDRTTVNLSALTGAGVNDVRQALLDLAGWQGDEGIFLARARHLHALEVCQAHLELALGVGGRLELLAEELRLAQDALRTITGEFTPDELLGEIFSRFCIGK